MEMTSKGALFWRVGSAEDANDSNGLLKLNSLATVPILIVHKESPVLLMERWIGVSGCAVRTFGVL